jgi:hypothetical protein
MTHRADQTMICHITDVENLPGILAGGGLRSDAAMAQHKPAVIGYEHIKQRRMTEIRVDCCGGRFVGEFVPFYFCPRSPMLFTVNRGNTGRPAGSQRTIVHLVSTLATGISQNRPWAISDGNAGAFHAAFSADLAALAGLGWAAIRATQWQGRTNKNRLSSCWQTSLTGRASLPWVATMKRRPNKCKICCCKQRTARR